jgi:hypothetical protein
MMAKGEGFKAMPRARMDLLAITKQATDDPAAFGVSSF